MQNRYKRALAGAVLLGLAAAPTRADRIPYFGPIRIPEAGLHPYPIQRLHAGIAWLKAHALYAGPGAKPVKEILVARGGPRMEAIDALEAVHHQLRSLGGAGLDFLPEGEDRYSRTSIGEALHSLDCVPGLAGLPSEAEQALGQLGELGYGSAFPVLSEPPRAHFAPVRGPEWTLNPEPAMPETPAVPEPTGVGLMALGILGMATLRVWSRHKPASCRRA